ncbi:MAG: hypothetical protein J0626_07015, partial [Rhodospirillaceae bacterium]|nr:hypothetical protein [Rhodospirillaceae bacterium]
MKQLSRRLSLRMLTLPALAGAASLALASNAGTGNGASMGSAASTSTSTEQYPVRVGAQEISYSEVAGQPTIRSGNTGFDALFTLAGLEMAQNSVSQIRDGSYNGGKDIGCNCFETGEYWHYVWTRDLSYAASLGLGMLDPRRVRNSLEFKLSAYRTGVTPGASVAGSSDGL